MADFEQQPAIYSIAWACLSSWYYGYHLSELNFPVTSLTCLSPAFPPPSRLPLCLGLTAGRYSFITAIFTVGGLMGSLMSSWVVQKEGLKGGIAWTGYLNLFGVIGMAMAPHWWILAIGRFVVGLSSGIAICLVPPFLSMIARSSPELSPRSGQIGSLHQLAIVLGLFCAQVAGWILTGEKGDIPGNWRYVVTIPGLAAAGQIALASRVFTPLNEMSKPEPVSTTPPGEPEEGGLAPAAEVVEPEIEFTEDAPLLVAVQRENQVPLRDLLSNTALRGPTILCASIMCLQQLSGVNAVMFYSTPVLRPLLPTSAGFIGIGITLVNVIMTLPAIFLVDSLGRKNLLLASTVWMGSMAALLAWAIDAHHQVTSAFAIVSFIAAFSIGLGPIPFLLISELVPSPAIPALSSLSLSCNWIANFFIALLFLPIRDSLSSPVDPRDPLSARKGEGRVFYVFTLVCVGLGLVVWRGLPKTGV